jgi:predicted glycosyltransferase
MRVLIGIGHPAHVHLFKNMIWALEKDGHEVKIATKDRGIIFELIDRYGFTYEKVDRDRDSLYGKALGLAIRESKILRMIIEFKPDISVAMGPIPLAHISKLLNLPCISFTDTEHDRFERLLSDPFVSTICTPSCFKKDLGKKQVRYNGYHELAYLHPNYFKPDSSVFDGLGMSKDDKFIVLRFVSWGASHDVGQHGFDLETKKRFVKELEKRGKVFITSEAKLGNEFDKYRINISPEKIHHLLYYATLYAGEGATMATEAGILGTPSIYISSLAGMMGNFEELENKYGLVYAFADPNKALEKTISLIENKNLKSKWQKKREKLMKDKIDVTKWMTEFIENYPESFKDAKENLKNPERFKFK